MLALAQLLVLLTASPALAGAHEAETASGEISASLAEEHTYFVGESGAWVHNTCYVGLDANTAAALVSQGSLERHVIRRAIGNRGLLMTETAEAEFRGLLRAGGPLERARGERLLARVSIVRDRVSARAAGLRPTGRLERPDIVNFGTYDEYGAQIFTSDVKALRAAMHQGIDFDLHVFIHSPVPLRGF